MIMVKSKFSEELGVVCHFLCDFFFEKPHNQRWEFKSKSCKKILNQLSIMKKNLQS